jgi:geranylgeranyl diphosphate synthase type I
VGEVLEAVLRERVAQATALDPTFGRDVAERVARFTLHGGKRMRSRFLWWGMRACGGGREETEAAAALRLAAGLELLQTCALVHDDVMDGSAVRRGRPSLHADIRAQYAGTLRPLEAPGFGQSVAVLAGDLALVWADDVTAATELPADRAAPVRTLWSAVRTEMVAGQYLDVHGQATSCRSAARAVRAALLKSALYSVERPLLMGAALAGAGPAAVGALSAAGRCAGVAFQLRDDLADVFADPANTGKPAGADIRAGKPTYLLAVARRLAHAAPDRAPLAVLDRCVGDTALSATGLAEVRQAMETTGARAKVEADIARLAAQGVRELAAPQAGLDPAARQHIGELVAAVTATGQPDGRPPRPPGKDGAGETPGLLGAGSGGAR